MLWVQTRWNVPVSYSRAISGAPQKMPMTTGVHPCDDAVQVPEPVGAAVRLRRGTGGERSALGLAAAIRYGVQVGQVRPSDLDRTANAASAGPR